jgi:hypothetical protein
MQMSMVGYEKISITPISLSFKCSSFSIFAEKMISSFLHIEEGSEIGVYKYTGQK